jgi:predicted O-linked N-acetylglucosamine transferase (SPINDLY family)
MRLLTAVPGSVLWLLRDNDAVENNLRREAESRGVDPDRLIFARRTDYADYLARFELAHLFLDTLPYNGGATAGDALWTGLPLLTCTGRSSASRMAGSLLRAVGLPELVTDSIEEYEALALNLARDPGRLGAIRERLGKNRLTAPLFDTDRFRRNIEAAYTEMYRTWECGEPPRPIAVTSSAESIDSLVAGTSDDGQ